MLHNEARELLVEAYEKHPVAKDIAEAFSVSKDVVYRLVRQKAQTGTVALRVSQRGRKKVLTEKDLENIRAKIESQNDITCVAGTVLLTQKARSNVSRGPSP